MTSFLTSLPSTPSTIAMPDELSDVTDIWPTGGTRFQQAHNIIGEYKASECTELAQRPNLRLELQRLPS